MNNCCYRFTGQIVRNLISYSRTLSTLNIIPTRQPTCNDTLDAAPSNAEPLPLDHQHRIMAASILIRQPITLRKLTEFEVAYEEYRLALQEEYARGEFHIPSRRDREVVDKDTDVVDFHEGDRGKGTIDDKSTLESPSSGSYRLPEEYRVADLDVCSLMRRLDSKLYFVIQNEQEQWQFPAKLLTFANESLHRITRQMLQELLGKEGEIYHMGCAPVAFYYEPLPDRTLPPYGVKTFFLKSQVIGGHFRFTPGITARTFAWLTKEELGQVLSPDYYKKVAPTLQS